MEALHRLRGTHRVKALDNDEYFQLVVQKAKNLFSVSITGQVGHLRQTYLQFIKEKAIIAAALKIATELVPGNRMKEVPAVMKAALDVGEGNEEMPIDVGDPDQILMRQSWRNDLTAVKVATGLTTIDGCLGGGLGPGELGVVLAGPSRGKTSTLVQFTANAIQHAKKNVYYVSREQNAMKIGTKLDCCLMGKTRQQLEQLPRALQEKWTGIYQKSAKRLKFKKYMKPCTADEVLHDIRQMELREGYKTELLVIDYADKMKPCVAVRGEMHDQIGSIYQDVFDLGQILEIPVWTASQTVRAALNADSVDLDDLGESYKKAHIADVVLAVCQNKDEFNEGNDSTARLFLAKNRDNPARQSVTISVDYATSTWTELAGVGVIK